MFQFLPTIPVLIGMKLKTFLLTKNNTFALAMNKVVWMLAKEILVDHSFARETWLKTNKVVPSRITLISKSLLVSSHLVLDALWLKIPVYTPMFTISSTTSTILSTNMMPVLDLIHVLTVEPVLTLTMDMNVNVSETSSARTAI
jgi:hypothetical protein